MRLPGTSSLKRARAYVAAYGVGALARELWTRMLRAATNADTPSRFHVEVSNCCNFDCEYCVLREHAVGDKVMSETTFAAVLPYLRNASSVALSGLAEPLMNRHFSEYLHAVRGVAPHALISIDTNASLLTEELARDMVAAKLGSLVFSLDGVDAELVDGIRQGGSLATLIDRIRLLNDVKRETGSRLPSLAATMVMQRKNASQLPAVVDLAADLGVSILTINGLEPYEAALSDAALWTQPAGSLGEVAHWVDVAQGRAKSHGIEMRFPSLRPQAGRCPQMGRPLILADGTVVPCSVLAYHRDGFVMVEADGSITERTTSTDRLTFGNVNERPLSEIWTDPEYVEFRARVASGDFPAACDACLMKHNLICPNEPLTAEQFMAAANRGTGA